MPKLKRALPKLHRHTHGQAYVKIDGRQIWLGRYGDPIAQERYDRLMAEWLANGRRLPAAEPESPNEVTVSVVVNEYRKHIEASQSPANISCIHSALRPVRRLYGSLPAAKFGPRKLEAVRHTWITNDMDDRPNGKRRKKKGLKRSTVNRYTHAVRRMFKWAAARELVPVTVWQALEAVSNLRAGEQSVKDSDKIEPVPNADVRRVRRQLSRPVRALTTLQLLTGARPSELLGLRAIDLETKDKVWRVEMKEHKTRHKGKRRVLLFGPRAQRVLHEFIKSRPTNEPLFSPRESFRELQGRDAEVGRRANQRPSPTQSDRTIGDIFDHNSYRRQITRACEALGVTPWTPYRLRHNAATRIRRLYGLEMAQLALGHSSARVTDAVYAERSEKQIRTMFEAAG